MNLKPRVTLDTLTYVLKSKVYGLRLRIKNRWTVLNLSPKGVKAMTIPSVYSHSSLGTHRVTLLIDFTPYSLNTATKESFCYS